MKKTISIILVSILCIFILINILSAFNLSFFGFRTFKIASGSMEPYLKVNDLILVKAGKDYKEDDIITFNDKTSYTTHRIIKIEGEEIITKGDANNTEDKPIKRNDIIGRLVYRFKIGKLFSYLLYKPFAWIIIVVIGIFSIIIAPNQKLKGKH